MSDLSDSYGSIQREVIGRLRKGRSWGLSLRMTAMIDVIFLLLIFFVLTAQFRREEQFLPIRLPGSAFSTERFDVVDPLRISIALKADQCQVDLGRNRIVTLPTNPGTSDLEGLVQSFFQVLEQDKRNPKDPIEIACEDAVSWELLVKVYNSLYSVGLEDVTFTLE